MKSEWRKVNHSDRKLRYGQKYIVQDLRMYDKGEPYAYSVWSEEQLQRLKEAGEIDDVNFRIVVAKSGTLGYSSTQDNKRNAEEEE